MRGVPRWVNGQSLVSSSLLRSDVLLVELHLPTKIRWIWPVIAGDRS